jgi:Tfp pilus assembly protein PilN
MLERFKMINQAAGVCLNLLPSEGMRLSACEINVNDHKLVFKKKSTELQDIGELKKHISAKTYIALNLSGKGIINRQTNRQDVIGPKNFATLLTNANVDDFYVQNFISGDQSFISAIRKSEADKWLEKFREAGFFVLSLSLGPFPVEQIVSQLNIYDQDFVFDGHFVLRNEQLVWTGVKYDENATAQFPLKIESELIDEKLVIPYAAVFQLILASKIGMIQADVPILRAEFDRVIDAKKMKFQSSLILATLFLSLLINFFLFSWLSSSNNKLTDQLSRLAQSDINVGQINKEIEEKESLLLDLGWDKNINKCVMVDEIASLLPEEITLRKISINPEDEGITRTRKSIAFLNREIKITGISGKIIPVNEWIERLKTKKWIKNVQLDNYMVNNELNTGQFIVVINY